MTAQSVPAQIKAGVDMRDNYSFANLVLLCGSGTTGCHGWVHAHPAEARKHGWIVAAHVADVAAVPILVREHLTVEAEYMLLDLEEALRTPIDLPEALTRLEAVA